MDSEWADCCDCGGGGGGGGCGSAESDMVVVKTPNSIKGEAAAADREAGRQTSRQTGRASESTELSGKNKGREGIAAPMRIDGWIDGQMDRSLWP